MPGSRTLRDTETPALVLDRRRLEANVERMHQTLSPHRVVMRPHVKTVKNAEIVRKVFGGGTGPITVSTLAEAEHFFEDGFTDVLYAVGVAPVKLQRAEALVRRGCALKVILDSGPDPSRLLRAPGRAHPRPRGDRQ
jgi:D-serine deaminase-like pyridoxal phosphate-dependent protein